MYEHNNIIMYVCMYGEREKERERKREELIDIIICIYI